MRPARVFLALTILLAGACADLQDLMTLSSSIREHYGAAANVNLTNHSHLRITFQNLPEGALKVDSTGRGQFARDVAAFAKAHYPKAAELEDVTIAFATVKSTGPITITHTDAPYSFAVRDLP